MTTSTYNPCVSLEEFKKALGSAADHFTKTELEQMLITMDRFADVFFDHWLEKINRHNIDNHESNPAQ